METLQLLRLIHITSFAAWFGTVLAAFCVVRTLEPKLSDAASTGDAQQNQALLKRFIKLESRIADVAFPLTIISGLLLAGLHHGWDRWVFTKLGLVILQATLTLGWIIRKIQPIAYPCTTARYQDWYRLFAISLSMFAILLITTFFFR